MNNNNMNKSIEANLTANRNPLYADEILILSDSSDEECSSECECDFCMDPHRGELTSSMAEFVVGDISQDDDFIPMDVDSDSLSTDEYSWIQDLPEDPNFIESWSSEPTITNDPKPNVTNAPADILQEPVFNVWENRWMTPAELGEFHALHYQRSHLKRPRQETAAEYHGLPHPANKKRNFGDN